MCLFGRFLLFTLEIYLHPYHGSRKIEKPSQSDPFCYSKIHPWMEQFMYLLYFTKIRLRKQPIAMFFFFYFESWVYLEYGKLISASFSALYRNNLLDELLANRGGKLEGLLGAKNKIGIRSVRATPDKYGLIRRVGLLKKQITDIIW